MDFDIHGMFILPTELSLFNYDKVKSVLQSIAPLKCRKTCPLSANVTTKELTFTDFQL